jgi:glutathione S-transferase
LIAQANPARRDPKVFADRLSELTGRLDQLETILADAGFAAGANFTLADCALAPTIFIANNTLSFSGAKPAIEGRPKLFRWWSAVQTRPSVKKALTEMAEALALQMQRG